MQDKPMLSVIVPIYNSQKFLEQCIQSILNQTYPYLEIILVNDGSTDCSPEICDQYAKKDVRIKVVHQKNGGLSAARNTGLSIASSPYMTFVDSDDSIAPKTYETAMKALIDANADMACFGVKVIGSAAIDKRKNDECYYQIKFSGLKNINSDVIKKMDVAVWNKIFKSDIIKTNNISFPIGRLYEDAAFFFKYIAFARKAFFIPEAFYFYLRHDDSIMVKTFHKTSRAIDHLYIFKDVYSFYSSNHLVEENKSLLYYFFVSCFSLACNHTPKKEQNKVHELGKIILSETRLDENPDLLIKELAGNYSLAEQIFSIKTIRTYDYKRKFLCILGIKIRLSKKYLH